LLGETPLPAVPRSVFEYISQKDRERLKAITSQITATDTEAAEGPKLPLVPTVSIPFTEPNIAQAALRGFQPFTADPAKQLRYHAYLRSQAYPDSESISRMQDQSIDEFNKELESYAKAALLFKPMSGAMASRFTSAAVAEQRPTVHEGLHTPSEADLPSQKPAVQELDKKEDSPKTQAARLGMYGPLTREVKLWQPARLLCKRFGVKDPNPEFEVKVTPASTGAVPSSEPMPATEAPPSDEPHTPESSTGRKGHRDLANIGLGEDEDQGRDILTYVRPPMDIFKAIFASDDEASDEEEAQDNKNDEQPAEATSFVPPQIVPAPPPSNSQATPQTTTSPPAPVSYQPSSEKVDLQTFKPVFVPRSERDQTSTKKKKKDKKKGGKAVLVSFELDEENSGRPIPAPQEVKKERPKKKQRKRRQEGEDGEDAMWVEKPPPEIVKDLVLALPPRLSADDSLPETVIDRVPGPPKGRKRAVDFM
jgi:G patch domain-containing protein 1